MTDVQFLCLANCAFSAAIGLPLGVINLAIGIMFFVIWIFND